MYGLKENASSINAKNREMGRKKQKQGGQKNMFKNLLQQHADYILYPNAAVLCGYPPIYDGRTFSTNNQSHQAAHLRRRGLKVSLTCCGMWRVDIYTVPTLNLFPSGGVLQCCSVPLKAPQPKPS